MNWEAVGALAELVGAIAVVATLAFLAVQLRQNTSAARAGTTQSVLSAAAGWLEHVSADSELSDLYARGLADRSSLEPPENVRFHFLMTACFRRWEAVYHHSTAGALADSDWEGLRTAMGTVVKLPGARAWWSEHRGSYNTPFREFIDALAAA